MWPNYDWAAGLSDPTNRFRGFASWLGDLQSLAAAMLPVIMRQAREAGEAIAGGPGMIKIAGSVYAKL